MNNRQNDYFLPANIVGESITRRPSDSPAMNATVDGAQCDIDGRRVSSTVLGPSVSTELGGGGGDAPIVSSANHRCRAF